MTTVVEIPGVGPVEFPNGMSEADIRAAASRLASGPFQGQEKSTESREQRLRELRRKQLRIKQKSIGGNPDGELSLEQRKALALARARMRADQDARASAQPGLQPMTESEREALALMMMEEGDAALPSGWRKTLRDNLLGDDDPTTQNFGEKIGSFLNKAGEAATFGLVGDEADARARSTITGQDYGQTLRDVRQQEELFERDNPAASLGAEIGGALASPVGAVGTLGRGANVFQRLIASSLAGAGLAGTYGFMEGEGGAERRLQHGQTAGQWGAAIGAGVPVVGGAVQRVANRSAMNRGIRNATRTAPSAEQLRAQSRAAYQAVDDAGVQIRPQAFDRLRGDMSRAMTDAGLDRLPGPGSLTPNAARVGQIADEMGSQMAPHPTAALPFGSLDQLRRHAGTAAGNMGNRTDSAAGMAAIKSIDDFVQSLGAKDVTGGDVKALQSAITKARDTYARASRTQTIEDAIDASGNYLSGGASGIRSQFRRILGNRGLSRGFSEAETRMMRRVVNGSLPERFVHLLGGGLGQMFQMGMGASVGSAMGVPGAVAGAVGGAAMGSISRRASDALAERSARQVRDVVAAGGLPQLPEASPLARLLAEELLRREAAASLSQ